jgi:ribosome-associated protein
MIFEEVNLEENQEFMTLGQFLKYIGLIGTGGQAKFFLQETSVFLNGEAEDRRGKKLLPEDQVVIEGQGAYIIKKA